MALEAVNKVLSKLKENIPSNKEEKTEIQDVFCFEDTFLTKDLKVTVKDVGELPAPLTEDFIKKIITVSSKAKFGKGEATVLDITVRDTHMIPACDLTVEIDKDCLENLLTRAKSGLNITQKCTLEPSLHNLLVYGPGQFFKMHRDSEKVPNMVATLVVVLPSFHRGGDLLIQHNDSKHVFFGSQNANFTKCIIFYADCLHEIQPVIEGYRVALTYNIVLKPTDEMNAMQVDNALDNAVKHYFTSVVDIENPQKLVYALNHSYSETNLKWGLLKGQDRTKAFALLAVAKKNNLAPCLALGKFTETYDIDYKEDSLQEETSLDYWVDEWNVKFLENFHVKDEELCYSKRTQSLFKPYKSEKSFTGNEGTTVEKWYRRGFVVLWSNKWDFSQGYKECLHELLKSLQTYELDKAVVLEEIKKIWSKIFQVKYWGDPEVVKYLLSLVIHLNDKEIAFSILSKLPNQIMQPGMMDLVLQIEDGYDEETWLRVMESWNTEYGGFTNVPVFIEEYLKHPSKKPNSFITKYLLEKYVHKFLVTNKDHQTNCLTYNYSVSNIRLKVKAENLWLALKSCFDLGNPNLESEIIQFVIENPNNFQPKTISKFFAITKGKLSPQQICSYNPLADAVMKRLEANILALGNENFWEIEEGFYCRTQCENCPLIQTFLRSKDIQKYTLSVNKKQRTHIASALKGYVIGGYLIITTDIYQRPPLFVIAKGQRVFQENQEKAAEFKRLKTKLEKVNKETFKREKSGTPSAKRMKNE